MNTQEQNIRIAELCGWKITQVSVNESNDDVTFTPPGKEVDAWRDANVRLPDYCNSLDAMAQAEATLTEDQRCHYASALLSVQQGGIQEWEPADTPDLYWIEMPPSRTFKLLSAPAPQRAAAFLAVMDGKERK
jgi:hypothetical protein